MAVLYLDIKSWDLWMHFLRVYVHDFHRHPDPVSRSPGGNTTP